MRVNLVAQLADRQIPEIGTPAVILNIRPVCGLPGGSEYWTSTAELFRLLDRHTDLNAAVLDRFRAKLEKRESAKLSSVNVTDEALARVGFLID